VPAGGLRDESGKSLLSKDIKLKLFDLFPKQSDRAEIMWRNLLKGRPNAAHWHLTHEPPYHFEFQVPFYLTQH